MRVAANRMWNASDKGHHRAGGEEVAHRERENARDARWSRAAAAMVGVPGVGDVLTRRRTGGTLDGGEIPRGQEPPGLGGGVTTMTRTDLRDRGWAGGRSMLPTLVFVAACSPTSPSVRNSIPTRSDCWQQQPTASLVSTGALAVDMGPNDRLEVSVAENPRDEDAFEGDSLVLRVRRSQDSEPLKMDFVSTYGQFELSLFDFTGDGIPEIILVTGMGRGTDVRSERLQVFDCASGNLERILVQPVSAFTSSCSHWSYERSIWVNFKRETRVLRLIQVRDEPVDPPLEDYPADAVLDFAYDHRAKVMKQTNDLLDDRPFMRPAAAAGASGRR
jgi:hypothetical protein